MEKKQIKTIYNWLEPQSVHDIQVFLIFANFYWQFIQAFSRFATPLTSMLITTLTAGPTASVEIGNKEQDGKGIQVEN